MSATPCGGLHGGYPLFRSLSVRAHASHRAEWTRRLSGRLRLPLRVAFFLLLLAAIGLSFLMERVLSYEEIWNQNHDDTGKDVAHGIV
jgi:hypothetical protein